MNVAEFVTDTLIEYGVTDAFGIPGGVILKFLAAMKARETVITPHLNYHEQMAGFAACGYAQASGKLGVAYSTRGPGITNMITSIAEAYQESLPVMFITAHGGSGNTNMRFENSQEIDVIKMVSGITKYATTIERVEDAVEKLKKAIFLATHGRKGPVVLDFAANLWDKEIEEEYISNYKKEEIFSDDEYRNLICKLKEEIVKSKRPIILIGDGVRYALTKEKLNRLAGKFKIPILSSRGSQDLCASSDYYFGYIGSHGIRYSNFILSKCDLIIAVGNRLSFPVNSKSFTPIFEKAKLIRIDIDRNEFWREIPRAMNYCVDAKKFFEQVLNIDSALKGPKEWSDVCNKLKIELQGYDCSAPVRKVAEYMMKDEETYAYVADVGNNEFWVSRAYELVHPNGGLFVSKSYGTLGVSIGRAIGVYYALRKTITCFIGDQGFQYNIQELQYVVQWKLPIRIVVLNNAISGMIRDHESIVLREDRIHVDNETGYKALSVNDVANMYKILYVHELEENNWSIVEPILCEIRFDSGIKLTPNLPKGNPCQDMEPLIERDKFEYLNKL